jgi:hypothetical protein
MNPLFFDDASTADYRGKIARTLDKQLQKALKERKDEFRPGMNM